PVRYANARKHLSLYFSGETEASRIHIESEVANGYPLSQHTAQMLESRHVIGSFIPGPILDSLISQIESSVAAFQTVEFERLERSLLEIFRLAAAGNSVLAPAAIRSMILGTIESSVMSRMRMMRWHGLALLKYNFFEGKEPVRVAASS